MAVHAVRRGGERGRQCGPSGRRRAPCGARRHRERASVTSLGVEPWIVIPAAGAAALYLRGWVTLRHRMPARFSARHAIAFLAGLGAVLVAASALLDASGHRFLWAHMIQHMLLMAVAPPLIWMGAPVAPILLGLPRTVRHRVAQGLAWPPVRRSLARLTHPAPSFAFFVVAFWAWHVPALYDLALQSDVWHHVEHICFIAAALLFWRPVVLPWPARSPWPRWAMVPYLVLADMQNNVMAAIFTFSDRVIYAGYATDAANRAGPALEDQAIAGLIMWVPGSLLFLVPAVWLVLTALTPARRDSANGAGQGAGSARATVRWRS